MSLRLIPMVLVVGLFLLGLVGSSAAQCRTDGDVEFVCGPVSPEDLIPGRMRLEPPRWRPSELGIEPLGNA